MSEYVTLVPLVDTLGNVNHDVTISGVWIYKNNYKLKLPLVEYYLDPIFASRWLFYEF